MRRPLMYLMAIAAASMPTPAERLVRIGEDRRRIVQPDTFVAPIVSNRAGSSFALELPPQQTEKPQRKPHRTMSPQMEREKKRHRWRKHA